MGKTETIEVIDKVLHKDEKGYYFSRPGSDKRHDISEFFDEFVGKMGTFNLKLIFEPAR